MKAVLQVTKSSAVFCDGALVSRCQKGLCVLLGIEENDTAEIADKMIDKILRMRIFTDANGKINLSSSAVGADILVISNFTLNADLSQRRPSFSRAMRFEPANELYQYFLDAMQKKADEIKTPEEAGATVFPGVFGGDMTLEIIADGPVTIVVDSAEF